MLRATTRGKTDKTGPYAGEFKSWDVSWMHYENWFFDDKFTTYLQPKWNLLQLDHQNNIWIKLQNITQSIEDFKVGWHYLYFDFL